VGELHTRRPKTLSEEEHIGMSTVTTTVNRNSYDGNSYNNKHRSAGSTIDYDRKDDYTHKEPEHEYSHRNSGDSIRKSGGYEDVEEEKAHDRVHSMADDAKDEYNHVRNSANDGEEYIKEEYD